MRILEYESLTSASPQLCDSVVNLKGLSLLLNIFPIKQLKCMKNAAELMFRSHMALPCQ